MIRAVIRARPYAGYALGVAMLGVLVWLAMPLAVPGAPGGLTEHQTAGSAAAIDRVQAAWRGAGVEGRAKAVMLLDLAFIAVFSRGAMAAGRHLRAGGQRWTGAMALAAGAVFLVTDGAETVAQTVMLWRFAGNDTLASIAAAMQRPKLAALAAALLAVPLGAAMRRFSNA